MRAVFGASLEFDFPWGPWERYDVTDVAHSCAEAHHSFESESESGVWDGAESPQVQIPPVVFRIHSQFPDTCFEEFESFLALASSDDFTDIWQQDIHCGDGLSVIVLPHVERLDFLWVVHHCHWAVEDLFGEEPFVFALEVCAPVWLELECVLVFCEELDGLVV